MKRKVAACLMAGMMMGGMVLPIQAAEKDHQMEVKYNEPSVYEISIPSEVTLAKTETQVKIGATKMNLPRYQRVDVRVKSGIENGAVTLSRTDTPETTTSKVSLESGGGGIIGDNEIVASFQGRMLEPDAGRGTLYFAGLPENLAAGNWAGQIVFSIELVTQ